MNFLQAIELLEQGKKIKRKNSGDAWIFCKDNILYCTNDSQSAVWLSSIESIKADDWEIYEETVSFREAFKAFREGKNIKRKSNNIDFDGGLISFKAKIFSYEDVISDDWIIF